MRDLPLSAADQRHQQVFQPFRMRGERGRIGGRRRHGGERHRCNLRWREVSSMKRSAAAEQLDLLAWTPPAPVRRFEERRIRAATLRGQLARAIAAALKDADDAGLPREAVAQRMSEFLGERVSLHVLNAYASQAREDHVISVARLVALLHATRDQRLLEMLAEPLGWAVIERRYLPMIELAAVLDRKEELARQAHALRRRARAEGAL
jgi:hypothetical protein